MFPFYKMIGHLFRGYFARELERDAYAVSKALSQHTLDRDQLSSETVWKRL